jgi:hypothetical protein
MVGNWFFGGVTAGFGADWRVTLIFFNCFVAIAIA